MPTQYANVYRNLIAHYIGLSTFNCNRRRKTLYSYRPLYRAVYRFREVERKIDQPRDLSPTISGCLRDVSLWLSRRIILIAHYIGLSTKSTKSRLMNKYLSPTISGCLPYRRDFTLIEHISYRPLYRAVYGFMTIPEGVEEESYRPLYRAVYK